MATISSILDGIPKIRQNGSVENLIIDDYVNHYNSFDLSDKVRLMTKYLISGFNSITVEYPGPPTTFNPYNYNYRNNVYLAAVFAGESDPITYPQITDEEAIENYAINTLGDREYGFIMTQPSLRNEVGSYLSFNEYSQAHLDLAKDLFSSHVNNTSFPHNKYDYKLDDGDMFNIRFQDEQNPNHAFTMIRHNTPPFDTFHGLDHLLSSLSSLQNPKEEFIGQFAIELLKDNGIIIPQEVTASDMFSIFNFTPRETYANLGRYTIGLDFRNNIGQTLWDNGVRFFEMLDRPYVIEGTRALLNGETFDFEFRGMVYELANLLSLDATQEKWLITHKSLTVSLDNFIQNNLVDGQISAITNDLAISITQAGLENTNNEIIEGLLSSLNSGIVFDIAPFLNENSLPLQTGPVCCLDNWNPSSNPEILYAFGAGLVQDAGDALWSMILRSYEWWVTDNHEGKFVRRVLEMRGIEMAIDIDDETLGELFRVRYDNSLLTIEYESGLGGDLLGLGTDLLDVLIILSPSRGGGAFLAVNGGGRVTLVAMRAHLNKLKNIAQTTLANGRGYVSFGAFKRAEGIASPGNALHHIVEQGGHKGLNQQKFGKTNIHNTKNIIDIPDGAGELHKKVTGYYNSIDRTIDPTKRVREAIKDWSFKQQYEFGIKKLKDFGWDGVTGLIN